MNVVVRFKRDRERAFERALSILDKKKWHGNQNDDDDMLSLCSSWPQDKNKTTTTTTAVRRRAYTYLFCDILNWCKYYRDII